MSSSLRQPSPEAALLARSLLGLVVLATLISIVGGVALLFAPIGAGARLPVLIAYSAFVLITITLSGWLFRVPLENLPSVMESLARLTPRGATALLAALLILLLIIVVQAVVSSVAPSISGVLFPIFAWSGVAIGVLVIVNSSQLKQWRLQTLSAWAAFGMAASLLMLLALLFTITRVALEDSGWLGALRGQSDARQLVWYGGELDEARSRQYWNELGQLSAQWLPYTYSRIEPHQGTLFTVSAAGLRGTVNPVAPDAGDEVVFFFGGSTMWGEGSRDAYTIPSQTAQLLYDAGYPTYVTNYGQVAYVTEQDLILFQRQLALGRIPDIAVFYGGFNDMAAVYMSDNRAGLPHNEVNRIRDLRAGAVLRAGRPVLVYPAASLDELDLSLVAVSNASPADIVEHYLANLRLIRAAADEYGVKTLFVWQPTPMFKRTLTFQEEYFRDENNRNWPGFETLYADVDRLLRERAVVEEIDDLLFLSDLFADEQGYIFYDRIHIIEDGNTQVAQAITNVLISILRY